MALPPQFWRRNGSPRADRLQEHAGHADTLGDATRLLRVARRNFHGPVLKVGRTHGETTGLLPRSGIHRAVLRPLVPVRNAGALLHARAGWHRTLPGTHPAHGGICAAASL